MKRLVLILALAAAQAWAADVAMDGAAVPAAAGWRTAAPADGTTLELMWDNGTRRWSVAWYTGADAWVGNDFDIRTLKTEYVKILKFKFYTRDNWPNTQWDGFRIAFYNFYGGVPGSRLWPTGSPGYFFRPSGLTGHVWVECDINWVCPSRAFVAAENQFYNHPNCDPFSVDSNETFREHSWEYYEGTWAPLSTSADPYRNLMLRLWVETGYTFPGVAPSSMGRVKALYY